MKSIIKPVEFISPLSEVDVRMTLKELCGSKWDNFPFNGEIDNNSFRLIKNRSPFVCTRGIPIPILIGNFVGQNRQTKVTISLRTTIMDIIWLLILILGTVVLACYSFISMLNEGFAMALFAFIIIWNIGMSFAALSYFLLWSTFHKSVKKIKKALGAYR